MSESDPRLSRTALPLDLVDAEGNKVELYFKPYCDNDYAEMDSWLRHTYMERLEGSLQGRGTQFASMAINAALAVIPTMSMFDKSYGSKLFSTTDGLTHAMWICCRDHNEDISKARIVELFKISANTKAAIKKWSDANVGEESGNSGKPGES